MNESMRRWISLLVHYLLRAERAGSATVIFVMLAMARNDLLRFADGADRVPCGQYNGTL